MSDFREGSQIGAYVLEKRLGGGSFGEVWRGHEAESGRAVAVKVLTGMLSSPDTAAMRAEVETLAAAAASRSDNIVHVLGGGSDPVPYIVMEYIEGSDLSALLSDGGKLGVERTIDVGLAISSALGALNEAGIVHRDIKPANVMVDTQGKIKLADFGIAKIVGYETMTMTGQAAMTMAYAAPEVWDDDSPFGRPSHRSDLYAMGILLFQCLTGETPFRGNYGALYRQHTERPPDLNALPPEVPPSLRALVRSCLEKKQTNRPAGSPACIAMLGRARAELEERRKGPPAFEPSKFGSWIKDAPHPMQPWAWYAHHETSNEQATVEVHFADGLEHGEALRRAVNSSPKFTAYGAERLLQTNRLLLHPGESWVSPPQGQYGFWVARQEKPQTPASLVTLPMLGAATLMYAGLISAATAENVSITPLAEDVMVLPDGSINVKRPGLQPTSNDPQEVALTSLRNAPLDGTSRDFIANAATFQALAGMAQNLRPADGFDQNTLINGQDTVIAGQNTVIAGQNTVISGRPPTVDAPTQRCASCNEPLLPGDRWCSVCGNQVGQPVAVPASNATEVYRAPVVMPSQGAGQAASTDIYRTGATASALQLELRRVSAKGASGEYEVYLYNTGRRAMPVNLQAYDMTGHLAYSLPAQVMLAEGAYERINMHVEAQKKRLFGGKKTTMFTVAASGGGGMDVPVTAEGEFDEEPSKVPMFAGGVMGVAAAALLAFALMSGGGGNKDGGNTAKTTDKPNNSTAMADFTPIATPPQPLAIALPPTPTPIPEPTPTPEPPPPPPEPTPVPVRAAPAVAGGGAGAGGGGTGGGGVAPVAPVVPIAPVVPAAPPPAPVPVRVNIASATCTSSLGTATITDAGPAGTKGSQLAAAPNDTIRCTANVTGDFTSIAWNGPTGNGSGNSFTTTVGAAKPGAAPYTVGLQVNWGGNPAIANFSVNVNSNAPSAGTSKCTTQGNTTACIN